MKFAPQPWTTTLLRIWRELCQGWTLELGDPPCHEIPTGVTATGLMTLAHHCPDLSTLCIHFQLASLCAPPAISRVTSDVGFPALRRDCAMKNLEVGWIPVPEESVLVVALTVAHIFPRIEDISYDGRKLGR